MVYDKNNKYVKKNTNYLKASLEAVSYTHLLVKPYAAKKLISALKEELNIPVNLHTHDSTGNGVSTLDVYKRQHIFQYNCQKDSDRRWNGNRSKTGIWRHSEGR